ncbi:hypothetical protein [Ruegeria faecimaris]|uniref:hypothetical protein n=1 Tax=Ruegeria faecimaris TaxID=686389 RepID=UPI0023311F28|nr:hypothetical protein [Ruegeria faecimaris]
MLTILYFFVTGAVLFALLRLACGPCVMGIQEHQPGVPVTTLGWALSLFLAATYLLYVAFDLIFPSFAMYRTWIGLMPGMTWLSLPSFLLGLLWAFLYGWYAALLFGGLFNAFAARTKFN